MNVQHRTSNIECRMKNKDDETDFKKPELLDDILEETKRLTNIFVTSIKTAKKKMVIQSSTLVFSRLGVIGRSTFDVRRSLS